jgi:hypothetical protein
MHGGSEALTESVVPAQAGQHRMASIILVSHLVSRQVKCATCALGAAGQICNLAHPPQTFVAVVRGTGQCGAHVCC